MTVVGLEGDAWASKTLVAGHRGGDAELAFPRERERGKPRTWAWASGRTRAAPPRPLLVRSPPPGRKVATSGRESRRQKPHARRASAGHLGKALLLLFGHFLSRCARRHSARHTCFHSLKLELFRKADTMLILILQMTRYRKDKTLA